MKLLMISRDTKVMDKESSVYARILEYSRLFDSVYVVVMGNLPKRISIGHDDGLYIYDMTSRLKIFSFIKTFFKSLNIAKKNKSENTWITSQDPFESGLLAFFVAKLAHLKLQLQFHTDCFNNLYIKNSLPNYFRTLMARIIVSHADSIRVVSERIKSSIIAINPVLQTRIHILPIWTDVEGIRNKEIVSEFNLRNKFPQFSKIILITARLEGEKNLNLGICAFQKMLRFDEKLGLIIAGSGSKESWLKELVRHLGIDDRVKFLGWVESTVSLYKTADLLLVTSWYEGYGLNMVESVASGTPVVSTDVGIASELGAILVTYDAGVIAQKVIEELNQKSDVKLKSQFITTKTEYLEKFKNTFV